MLCVLKMLFMNYINYPFLNLSLLWVISNIILFSITYRYVRIIHSIKIRLSTVFIILFESIEWHVYKPHMEIF